MKASVSSEFVIKDGEVESSSVVLERREDGEWCKLDNNWLEKIFNNRKGITPLASHSYFGLKVMFRKNGWISGILKWLGNHRCDYQDGEVFRQFWVPVLSETMMRRWWRGSREEWDEWDVFPQSGFATSIFSVEGFKEFIEKNPGLGWDMQYMKQDKYDPHLWHHKGEDKNELWFPVIKSEVKKVLKARTSRLVCVNTINAALTEGREYEVKGEVDGLLQVVDDVGLLQEFMPSRFKES
jgi:hypothetical protein